MKPSSLLRLLADTIDNGGGTFQLTGEAYKPTTGYAVSLEHGMQFNLSRKDGDLGDIDNAVILGLAAHNIAWELYSGSQRSQTHLGTWISEGVLYFDYVVIVATEDEARALSLANNQQAFFSFATGEVIPTALATQ